MTQLLDVDPVHAWPQAFLKQGDFLNAGIDKQLNGLILEHQRHEDAFPFKRWSLQGATPCLEGNRFGLLIDLHPLASAKQVETHDGIDVLGNSEY